MTNRYNIIIIYSSPDFQISEVDLKVADVTTAVLEELSSKCNCPITADIIEDESFSCLTTPTSVTYRGRLSGTSEKNSTILVSYTATWVSTGPSIRVRNVLLLVDKNCSTFISSFSEEGCLSENTSPTEGISTGEGLSTTEIVGIVFGAVGAIGTIATIISSIVTGWYRWNKRR